jgi:SAM-dependent methyltransferase
LIEQVGLRNPDLVGKIDEKDLPFSVPVKEKLTLADIMAIDGDADILAIARRKCAGTRLTIEWLQALAQDLPFPTGHFDRVVTSLFFHHLSPDAKQRTACEVFRVLRPGGELHVADWGRPTSPVMRGLFFAVQMLDGFENTRDHVAGALESFFQQAGFVDVAATRSLDTALGTIVLYRGTKPATADQ